MDIDLVEDLDVEFVEFKDGGVFDLEEFDVWLFEFNFFCLCMRGLFCVKFGILFVILFCFRNLCFKELFFFLIFVLFMVIIVCLFFLVILF